MTNESIQTLPGMWKVEWTELKLRTIRQRTHAATFMAKAAGLEEEACFWERENENMVCPIDVPEAMKAAWIRTRRAVSTNEMTRARKYAADDRKSAENVLKGVEEIEREAEELRVANERKTPQLNVQE